MEVYLHHKYPENLWHDDPSIILETILNKLNFHDQDLLTQISKQIETAVNHVTHLHPQHLAIFVTSDCQGGITCTS